MVIELELTRLDAPHASHDAVRRLRGPFEETASALETGGNRSGFDLELLCEIACSANGNGSDILLEPLVNSPLKVRQIALGPPLGSDRADQGIPEEIAAGRPKAAGIAMRRRLMKEPCPWTNSERQREDLGAVKPGEPRDVNQA